MWALTVLPFWPLCHQMSLVFSITRYIVITESSFVTKKQPMRRTDNTFHASFSRAKYSVYYTTKQTTKNPDKKLSLFAKSHPRIILTYLIVIYFADFCKFYSGEIFFFFQMSSSAFCTLSLSILKIKYLLYKRAFCRKCAALKNKPSSSCFASHSVLFSWVSWG